MRGQNIILKNIEKGSKILDVGGAFMPFALASHVIDIMPWTYTKQRVAWPEKTVRRFSEETYVCMDICGGKWPFEDKHFDFVICSQTLEDLRDPLYVCSEIMRVGKKGWIETPSRFLEQTFNGKYCGYSHHRWLVEIQNNHISFINKFHKLNSNQDFILLPPPNGYTINPQYEVIGFLWENNFTFEEKILIEEEDIDNYLKSITHKVKDIKDYYIPQEFTKNNTYEFRKNPSHSISGEKAIPSKLEKLLFKIEARHLLFKILSRIK